MTTIQIPSPADFHTHLRQGNLMKLVTPHVPLGGIDLAYVMPNTSPPILTVEDATAYHAKLQPLAPQTKLLMTLYLSPSLKPENIVEAKKTGIIAGVKSYPRGVTTGSDSGVESYDMYFPVFEEMERQGLVLNLHGEVPCNPKLGTSVLNAEERFLSNLVRIHTSFPRLKIVLEHATTKASVDTVLSLGDTVGCTITPHHLALTVDDWAGNNIHYCKPVAKTYEDRNALREIVASGHPRFFLGSDSAPHPLSAKLPQSHQHPSCAAGIYTSPFLVPLVATVFESLDPVIPLDRLVGFVSTHGRAFYNEQTQESSRTLTLRRISSPEPVAQVYSYTDDNANETTVVPFWQNKPLLWEIVE